MASGVRQIEPSGPATWRNCSTQRVWYSCGVRTLPASGTGMVSQAGESGSGTWPMYQTTGTAATSLLLRSRIAIDHGGGFLRLGLWVGRRRPGIASEVVPGAVDELVCA